MNPSPLTAAQRKRGGGGGGRVSLKTASTTGIPDKEVDSKNKLEMDSVALAISPTAEVTEVAAPAAAASVECRRSSRKKIIKFDVRDLLNKHRKPHKIQIEARIDSNAPQTPKPTSTTTTASMGGGGGSDGGGVGLIASTSADLSSKQKAFMEKSAIFRRMSMSEQQNKILNTPPLPPPLSAMPKIGSITSRKTNVNILNAAAIDPAKIAQARRLSRTQEIFNASLMKSKQNSSLIVAQIESTNSSSVSSSGSMLAQTIVTTQSPAQQQKPITTETPTNKRKSASNTLSTPTTLADTSTDDTVETAIQKRRGRSLKSKVTTPPQSTATKTIQKTKPESNEVAAATNTARNWKEYKANLAKSNESLESKAQKRFLTRKPNTTPNEDVILEISSTSSELEFTAAPIKQTSKDKNETEIQKNFAAVGTQRKSSQVVETEIVSTEPELVVAAVEEISTEKTETEKSIIAETADSSSAAKSVVLPTTESMKDAPAIESTAIDASSPARATPGSRKSSGSESETGSDRSNKSYKKGDKLRVSLKRLTLPGHGTISSPSSSVNSDSDSRSSPTSSSAYTNKSSNSNDDDNAGSKERVKAGKGLPTRRSHRFSLKNTDDETTTATARRKSQTKTKQSLNESLKQTTMEVEKTDNDIALAADLNEALNTAVKTDNSSALSKAEEAENVKEVEVKNPVLSINENENVTSEMLVETHVDKPVERNKKKIKDKDSTPKTTQAAELETINIKEAAKVDNKDVEKLNADDPVPTVSHVATTKRERRITLPLKKQVSKFKMYEAAVQDVAANVETSTLLDILNTVKQNTLTIGATMGEVTNEEALQREVEPKSDTSGAEATKQSAEVNAELQPLVGGEAKAQAESRVDEVQAQMPDVALEIELEFENDSKLHKKSTEIQMIAPAGDTISEIIAEVESHNLQRMTAGEDKNKEELLKTTVAVPELAVENKSLEHSTSSPLTLESPTNLDEHSVCSELSSDKIYDESSSEGIMSSKSTRKGKKTPSPTPSSEDSLKETKKPTRRYERRSQRGNASEHKTLEETFAEIAAASSKAVLELKAKKVDVTEEGAENVEESVIENFVLEENADALPGEDGEFSNLELEATGGNEISKVTTQIMAENGDKMEESVEITTIDGGKKIEEVFKAAEEKVESAEETLTPVMDYNLTKALREESDSNSNHATPSRRGRRTRTKKSPTVSPPTVAKTPETDELKVSATEQDLPASWKIVEEATESISQTIDPTYIVERTEIASEITIMSTDEATTSACNLTVEGEASLKESNQQEIQNCEAVTEAFQQYSVVESLEQREVEVNIEAIPSPTEGVNKKTQKESSSPPLGKSRKHKRGTSLKSKKCTNTESETKKNEPVEPKGDEVDELNSVKLGSRAVLQPKKHETDVESVIPEDPKPQMHGGAQHTPLEVEGQETLQASRDNASENTEKVFEKKGASKADSTPVVEETAAQNVTEQMLEQRAKATTPTEKSTTPTDKSAKKTPKRKSPKLKSDDKPATNQTLPLAAQPVECPPQIVETKAKNNEKEDTTVKGRKSRKGKHSPDANKDNNVSVPLVAETDSHTSPKNPQNIVVAEVEVKDAALAKAPPKKRLLKMQMLYEEKAASANASTSVELPTTSALSSSSTKTSSTSQATCDTNKPPKEKKTKKEMTKTSDDQATKRASYDNQNESSSLDEESRSATSTPVSKRSKQQKTTPEKISEEKPKAGAKRKSKWDQQPSSAEKKDDKSGATSAHKSEKKKLLSPEDTTTTSTSPEQSKKMEEKSAKKKRQKKLKEAFEAALNDALNKQQKQIEASEESKESVAVKETNVTERVEKEQKVEKEEAREEAKEEESKLTENKPTPTGESKTGTISERTVLIEPEEDPDPLKDIEKFIEDGVNLLKRGYKIDDDSVDEVISTKTLLQKDDYKKEDNSVTKTEDQEEKELATNAALLLREGMITPNESINSGDGGDLHSAEKSFDDSTTSNNEHTPPRNLYYETPADTPVATPTSTPPPKSPTNDSSIEEISGVRRSHRIKQITKTPKALVGRGLVRDRERFSIKDDVEMKTHYSLDDHLTDLAQVEAKNAKFLKEMEERLSNFQVIKDNEYKCERVISREARKMLCDCFLTAEEEERGELGCGEDCLNRLLMIECGPECNVKDRCTNNRFQKVLCSPCRVFRTEKKGFGIMADIEILPGEFIMEYVGEVINGEEFEQRRTAYSLDKNRHYYFMALRSDAIIDATIKGNISRFINHSCDPNAETQKWTVNGELRIGFFSRKSIMPGEEITFDYQYQRYGREAQRCYCEAANCRGWIGEEPNSDEGEQIDEDSDALADVSDEDDSDDSSAEAEDAQKKFEVSKMATHSEEDGKVKLDTLKDKKKKDDAADDDAKAKLKKLTAGKLTDKARKKRKIKEKKAKRMRTSAAGEPRYLEDPDIEDEVKFLSRAGLRNQSDTLRFSRLVVRAKLSQTRLNLLKILRNAELPCRRLFLDYHGLRLLHGWMIEDGGDMAIRLALLEALESLPIANKTVLTDSKVYQSVRNWCGNATGAITASASSPSDESSKESTSSNSMQIETSVAGGGAQEVPSELQKLALKLTTTWNSLPEIFRIPKRERIEQMKEHEREADRQYAEDANRSSYASDRYQRDRFGRGPTNSRYSKPSFGKDNRNSSISVLGSTPNSDPRRRPTQDNNGTNNDNMKHLSKEQRREMFAAKVARDEAEKRLAEERREFETKCRFFGLDPKKTRPQDVPFCVDPSTGQWFSVARQAIATPPCYAHIQVQPKPKSLDPADYKLPAVVATLPQQWKFAITTLGQIYYYHQKQRVPQWHPPTPDQIRAAAEEADSTDSESCEEAKLINESSEEDEILIGMDETKLKALIDKKIEHRRNKRYNRLVDSRPISPRKEEDRIYNQIEMRKYKENKEKIRKRKEDIRRKRAEALKTAVANALNSSTGDIENLNTDALLTKIKTEIDSDEPDDALPIQDYLLSSDEEEIMKAECNNSPLLEKIVQGDKIVDELDALTTKRALKRPLPPHRDLSALSGQSGAGGSISSSGLAVGVVSGGGAGSSSGGSEHKRRKSDKKEKSKKSKDSSDSKYRRNKEKFRCEIAGIIVQHLKPYRKESCALGRIQSDEDFNHLARKLTHFVMVKELKYCEAVGQTLIVTESVKNKSREFIKKYMAKYGGSYVKPVNDPEFKDIPFTI